jgi:hypothetical protein
MVLINPINPQDSSSSSLTIVNFKSSLSGRSQVIQKIH